jgi:hypothetical protein
MADISKCQNSTCKLSSTCYRYIAPASNYQTFLVCPEEDCEENDYEYYIK